MACIVLRVVYVGDSEGRGKCYMALTRQSILCLLNTTPCSTAGCQLTAVMDKYIVPTIDIERHRLYTIMQFRVLAE